MPQGKIDFRIGGRHYANDPQPLKKYAACFLAVVLLVLGAGLHGVRASAAETVEKQTVRVGYFQADGYQEMNEDGTLYGYGFDFLQMMLRYNDWKYEYTGFESNWGDMLRMLERGEADLVTLANKKGRCAESGAAAAGGRLHGYAALLPR